MEEVLRETLEIQNWGYNLLTLSFIATVFFTVLQAWGLWKQNRKIRRERSGTSVSVISFGYFGSYFFALLAYGVHLKSIAIVFNGLLGCLYIATLVELWKRKSFTRAEKILLSIFPFMILLMVATTHKDALLSLLLGGILISATREVWELRREKSAGAIEPRRILVFMATGVFWFLYALKIRNPVLAVFHPVFFVILTYHLILWYKKSKESGT